MLTNSCQLGSFREVTFYFTKRIIKEVFIGGKKPLLISCEDSSVWIVDFCKASFFAFWANLL